MDERREDTGQSLFRTARGFGADFDNSRATHIALEADILKTEKHKRRFGGTALGAGALLTLAGCGGGGSDNFNNNTANASLPSVSLTALLSDNRLLTFNSRTPGTSTVVSMNGLTSGDRLKAIDNRFTPPSTIVGDGNTGLYAIGQNGASQQLYRIAVAGTTATATAVGTRFNLVAASPTATAFGFDFNPAVDRIRVVEPTSNRNFRVNPNTGAFVDTDADASNGVQGDGTVTYASTDANAGKDPDAVGAAYTNPDADATTGTTLYILDAGNDKLAIQGRGITGDPNFVSPNAGQLFTVANLGIDLTADSGFDISPTGNAAFVSNGKRIYGISLSTGAVTGGASVSTPDNTSLIGLAATS